MSDISRNNVAGPSIAQSAPEERDETGAPPQARSSSCLPITSGLMAYIRFRRQRNADHPASTSHPRSEIGQSLDRLNTLGLQNDARLQRLSIVPPGDGRRLERSLARREAPFLQQMQDWARGCEDDVENWHPDWVSSTSLVNGVEQEPHLALQDTAAILASVEPSHNRSLNLRFQPLPRFPPDISRFAHLENFYISGAGLQALPESMDALCNLRNLNLINNPLRALPASLAGLTQLRRLDVTGSPLLTELPDNLVSRDATTARQGLVDLQILRMIDTGLTRLPSCVTLMNHLTELTLDGSPIQELPHDIDHLLQLQTLSLQRTSVTELPSSLGALPHLTALSLSNCSQLRSLPENIGDLQALRSLDLSGCNQLEGLPSSISHLSPHCEIRVPRHLQEQPERRLDAAPIAGVARTSFQTQREWIDAASQWMLEQVMEERNPFVHDHPSYLPDQDDDSRPLTLGDIPAVNTMLQESQYLSARNALEYGSNMRNFAPGDALHANNLAAAVRMWRAREMAVAQDPSLVNRFPHLAIDFPEELRIRPASPLPVVASASSVSAPPGPLPLLVSERDVHNVSQRMLNMVMEQERNPFVAGNPRFLPNPDDPALRVTIGQIPALRTMLEESRNPYRLAMLGSNNSYLGDLSADEPPNVVNLAAAVGMWRARELRRLRHLGGPDE